MTFPTVHKYLTCDLDLSPTFKNYLRLPITDELRDVQFSYLTNMFLFRRSFNWNQHMQPNDIDHDLWPS